MYKKQGHLEGSNELLMQVGSRLKAVRQARGLSQRELAQIIGKGTETISNFERGKVAASLDSLERIAVALGVGIADFFETSPVPPSFSTTRAAALYKAVNLLSEDDLEVVAALIRILQARRA